MGIYTRLSAPAASVVMEVLIDVNLRIDPGHSDEILYLSEDRDKYRIHAERLGPTCMEDVALGVYVRNLVVSARWKAHYNNQPYNHQGC